MRFKELLGMMDLLFVRVEQDVVFTVTTWGAKVIADGVSLEELKTVLDGDVEVLSWSINSVANDYRILIQTDIY